MLKHVRLLLLLLLVIHFCWHVCREQQPACRTSGQRPQLAERSAFLSLAAGCFRQVILHGDVHSMTFFLSLRNRQEQCNARERGNTTMRRTTLESTKQRSFQTCSDDGRAASCPTCNTSLCCQTADQLISAEERERKKKRSAEEP